MDEESTCEIILIPIKWQQSTYHSIDDEEKENIHILCEADIIYPEEITIIGDENAVWPKIPFSLYIAKGKPIRGNGEPLERGIGLLNFHKSGEGENTFDTYPASIHSWTCVDDHSFDDLWERIKNNTIQDTLITVEVSGIIDKGDFDIEYEWNINDQDSLNVLSARFQYNSPSKTDVRQVMSRIKIRGEHEFEIDRKKTHILSKTLLNQKGIHYSQYNSIVNKICERVAEYSTSIGEDENDFENRLYDSIEIINDIRWSVNQNLRSPHKPISDNHDQQDRNEENGNHRHKEWHTLWYHGDPIQAFFHGFESNHAKKVDVDLLTDSASKYITRPWMENELLEWIIVDALVFAEITGYGEELKKFSSKSMFNINWAYFSAKGNLEKMIWHRLKGGLATIAVKIALFIGLPLAVAIYSFKKGYELEAIFGGGGYLILLFILLIFRVFHRLIKGEGADPFQRKLDLLEHMNRVYHYLGTLLNSPTFIREQLASVADRGVIWPSAIFTILDNAVKRNPAIWGIDDSLRYRE